MRFVLAVGAFILSAAFLLLGFAQRTIWLGPSETTETIANAGQAQVMVIDGATLGSLADRQRVTFNGTGDIVAVYAKDSDVEAWLGDVAYSTIHLNERTNELFTRLVAGTEQTVPDPRGSDLWADEFVSKDRLQQSLDIPVNYWLMATTTGESGSLDSLTISWTLNNATPWAGPAFLAGSIFALLGIAFYIWAVIDWRKKRGPRRKNPNMPNRKSRKKFFSSLDETGKQLTPKRGRRSVKTKRIAVLTASIVSSTLLLGGCSANYWPKFPDSAETEATTTATTANPNTITTPTMATPTPEVPDPGLSLLQFEKVIFRISDIISQADESLDIELASKRLTGPALAARTAAYKIKKADSGQALPAGIDSKSIRVFLPQQTNLWPRSVMAVVDVVSGDNSSPQLLFLTQQSPRENYKLMYQINLYADLPEVAAAADGSGAVPADTKLLVATKEQVLITYASILLSGDAADENKLISAAGDQLRSGYGAGYKKERKAQMPKYAKIEYANAVKTEDTLGFWTNDAGAIVLGTIVETEKVEPTESKAKISPSGQVLHLSGVAESEKGVIADYQQQVVLYIPPLTAGGEVMVIGYSQDLISATEVQ